MSASTVKNSGLLAGVWNIDPTHSEVGFTVRHLMVSKVRGNFTKYSGSITIAEDPLQSKAEVHIDATSIATHDDNRDNHLRTADFLEVDKYPEITFVSKSVRESGDDYVVTGDLTIHGITRPIDLELEYNGVSPDPWGGQRAGFSATAEIGRSDFGIDIDLPLDGGGVVVGEKIRINLEIESVYQKD